MTTSKNGRKAPLPVKSARAKAPVTPAKKGAAGTEAHPAKVNKKEKLVRDSFTIPKSEYALLESLKVRATNLKRPTKKSEMLRAGIAALHAMPDRAFLSALNGVPTLKTGRPTRQDAARRASEWSGK